MTELLLFSAFAGAMIPLGGWIARNESVLPGWLEREFRHSVIAFGAGALLSAVALVLVPEGMESLPGAYPVVFFSLGAAVMAWLDTWLVRSGLPRAQMLAMLSDFAPEAMAMGALFVVRPDAAPLLALLIGMQNLPEGFNAYREAEEKVRSGASDHRLRNFGLLALVGPGAALAGFFFLADYPAVTGGIMCAAAGGILFLIFQDIAPQVKLENRVAPPLSAVAGFMLGIAGHLATGTH
ncbi:ZIP family metal transporter [Roseovarius salis]|uniref:ZIP family metal transporter n=1 Tax=Roseovarius salis TaxID=3376063 RepID=UPI0037C62A6D